MQYFPSYGLLLADGIRWVIAGNDAYSSELVTLFAKAMQLNPFTGIGMRLIVSVNSDPFIDHQKGIFVFRPKCSEEDIDKFSNLLEMSLIIARESQKRGGILLHGALVECNSQGIILAGPSGIGKSTASRRLKRPWYSLCDDTSLVVRDKRGKYWAHPWPTWSQFIPYDSTKGWNIQDPVELKRIFFLIQDYEESVESLDPIDVIPMLLHSANQVNNAYKGKRAEEKRRMNLVLFDNVFTLAGKIPVSLLHLSLNGDFWTIIKQAL